MTLHGPPAKHRSRAHMAFLKWYDHRRGPPAALCLGMMGVNLTLMVTNCWGGWEGHFPAAVSPSPGMPSPPCAHLRPCPYTAPSLSHFQMSAAGQGAVGEMLLNSLCSEANDCTSGSMAPRASPLMGVCGLHVTSGGCLEPFTLRQNVHPGFQKEAVALSKR